MVRQPAVAGRFYKSDAEALREELAELMPKNGSEKAIGIVAPHAGFIYSGKVAGSVYGQLQIPSSVIVLCPNHTGMGSAAALFPTGQWDTPLGPVPINSRLSKLILKHVPLLKEDELAHRFEHSLEVQLPFLMYRNPEVSIAALCLSSYDFESCRDIGEGIVQAIREYGEEVLIVASSDMTHYESDDAARVKDDIALSQVLALNPEGLLTSCRQQWISMCGVVPTTVMMVAAKALGATRARLDSYATSGDVTGDRRRVVAYAGVTLF
ncbi:AmmeMemoRadiSam system protein B [Geomonas sp. RF6]|uniref:AmmeMemoRadiSam system protein B n=1 Tax=Geomonas sp. RF6 TaxID=2897342 RepID=UPI001E39DFA4|nr:AmmeMemoRadiSam system protein B [Geomonas sp. RF6]UFS69853.1 AmmeMemoRadiSam system protein B [Geomonas sp. RF6]